MLCRWYLGRLDERDRARRRMEAEESRDRPSSKEVIEKACPPTIWKASDEMAPTCAVCLEAVEEGDRVITTQCHHVFHADCVMQWWTFQSKKTWRIACPMCKQTQHVSQDVE